MTSKSECQFCQDENCLINTYTKYVEFNIGIYGNEISISDDYGHEDTWKVNFCPICGRELKQEVV